MGTEVLPTRAGGTTPLTQKLSRYSAFSRGEIPQLRKLQSESRPFRRGEDLLIEGRPFRMLFVIMEGFAIRYRTLRDGRRHILNLVLPGDIAGVPDCFFESTLNSVRALTKLSAAPVPLERVVSLLHTHPGLAAKLFWSFSCEAAIYAEHLIAVGRRTALERVAHFLLEHLVRLQAVSLADQRSFTLPLTQELIADALGLSVPYVNQVLRSLRDDNLVYIKDKVVIINDADALSALVGFDSNYLKPLSILDLSNDAE